MKKLMIGAVVAMLGIAANAAAVTWSIEEAYAEDSEYTKLGNTYNAYLMVYGATFTGADQNYALELAQADLAKGDVSFLSKAITIQGGGTATAFKSGAAGATTADLFADDQTFGGYVVILDGTPTTATKAFIAAVDENTDPMSFKIEASGGSDTMMMGYLEYTNDTAWATVNAPEPTSGLLLLIGVAGLALKRKRA